MIKLKINILEDSIGVLSDIVYDYIGGSGKDFYIEKAPGEAKGSCFKSAILDCALSSKCSSDVFSKLLVSIPEGPVYWSDAFHTARDLGVRVYEEGVEIPLTGNSYKGSTIEGDHSFIKGLKISGVIHIIPGASERHESHFKSSNYNLQSFVKVCSNLWFGSDSEPEFLGQHYEYVDEPSRRTRRINPLVKEIEIVKKRLRLNRLKYSFPKLAAKIDENSHWLSVSLPSRGGYAFFSRNKSVAGYKPSFTRKEWDDIQLEWSKLPDYFQGFFDTDWRINGILESKERIMLELPELCSDFKKTLKDIDTVAQHCRRALLSRNSKINDTEHFWSMRDASSFDIGKENNYFLVTYLKQCLKNRGLRYGVPVFRRTISTVDEKGADIVIPPYKARIINIDTSPKFNEVWSWTMDRQGNITFYRSDDLKITYFDKKSKQNYFYWKKSLKYGLRETHVKNMTPYELDLLNKGSNERVRKKAISHADDCKNAKSRALPIIHTTRTDDEFDKYSMTSSRSSQISRKLTKDNKALSIEMLKKIAAITGKMRKPKSCCYKKLRTEVTNVINEKIGRRKEVFEAFYEIFDNVDEYTVHSGIAWALKRHPEVIFK